MNSRKKGKNFKENVEYFNLENKVPIQKRKILKLKQGKFSNFRKKKIELLNIWTFFYKSGGDWKQKQNTLTY